MEDIYMYSDLIDMLQGLGLVGDPTLHPVIKHRYRNRERWEGFYKRVKEHTL